MSFDYAKSKTTADTLLAQFGQNATLTRVSLGLYDASTGAVAKATTTQVVKAVVLDFSNADRASRQIEQNDRKAIIAVGSLLSPPSLADTLTVGGAAFKIVNVSPVAPGGTDLLYTCQVRR